MRASLKRAAPPRGERLGGREVAGRIGLGACVGLWCVAASALGGCDAPQAGTMGGGDAPLIAAAAEHERVAPARALAEDQGARGASVVRERAPWDASRWALHEEVTGARGSWAERVEARVAPWDEREVEAGSRRVWVYVLAGQSNMNGHGRVSALPEALQAPVEATRVFWRGTRESAPLGPSSWLKGRFGPEVTLGRVLGEAHGPERVVLVKAAVHWTNLTRDWRPGDAEGRERGWMYGKLIASTELALEELRREGYAPELGGLLWMQGETDGTQSRRTAAAYEGNLERFIRSVRRDLGTPCLPVVLGRVAGLKLPYGEPVRRAQVRVARRLEGVAWVPTRDLPHQRDRLHFDAQGQQRLGVRFGAGLWVLREEARRRAPGECRRAASE